MTINAAHNHHTILTQASSVPALRQQIISVNPSLSKSHQKDQWWLLGTSHCQLCDEAKALIARLQMVYPITYCDVDISEFDEALMMTFATTIPVLLTPLERLNYPFSVMDLERLLSE